MSTKESGLISQRLYIDGLAPEITENVLVERFKKFGEIDDLVITKREYSPRHFAHFTIRTTKESISSCISAYSGSKWRGETLKLAPAKKKIFGQLQKPEKKSKLNRTKRAVIINRPNTAQSIRVSIRKSCVDKENVLSRKLWKVSRSGVPVPLFRTRIASKNNKIVIIDPTKNVKKHKRFKLEDSRPEDNRKVTKIPQKTGGDTIHANNFMTKHVGYDNLREPSCNKRIYYGEENRPSDKGSQRFDRSSLRVEEINVDRDSQDSRNKKKPDSNDSTKKTKKAKKDLYRCEFSDEDGAMTTNFLSSRKDIFDDNVSTKFKADYTSSIDLDEIQISTNIFESSKDSIARDKKKSENQELPSNSLNHAQKLKEPTKKSHFEENRSGNDCEYMDAENDREISSPNVNFLNENVEQKISDTEKHPENHFDSRSTANSDNNSDDIVINLEQEKKYDCEYMDAENDREISPPNVNFLNENVEQGTSNTEEYPENLLNSRNIANSDDMSGHIVINLKQEKKYDCDISENNKDYLVRDSKPEKDSDEHQNSNEKPCGKCVFNVDINSLFSFESNVTDTLSLDTKREKPPLRDKTEDSECTQKFIDKTDPIIESQALQNSSKTKMFFFHMGDESLKERSRYAPSHRFSRTEEIDEIQKTFATIRTGMTSAYKNRRKAAMKVNARHK